MNEKRHADRSGALALDSRRLCDGVKIPKTFMFDDEAGIVLSYAVNDQGRVKADKNRQPIVVEHYGVVTYEMKARPE